MLRMYECQWCFEKQVHDHDSVKLVQAGGERMAFHLNARCHYGCRSGKKLQMIPMVKDVLGDWKHDRPSNNWKTSRKYRVEAPIMWH